MNVKIKLLPYERFKRDGFESLAKDLKESTIVLIDAKLTPQQEANIIEQTMENVSENFIGIELASISSLDEKNLNNLTKFKHVLVEALLGKKRGFTVIGPAQIVHKIKKNPENLMLYM